MKNLLSAQPDSDDLLLQAVRRLLRPLARLFIRKNLPLQVLSDLMKEMYVNVAEASLKKATDSQISLMTGVHRKDVRKYRDKSPDVGREVPHVSTGAEIFSVWAGSPQYTDAAGRALPLPYANRKNPSFSFSALAESVSKDVRPRAILDEMLRQGVARYDGITDEVSLNAEAFIPQDGWEEKLYYFGRNGEDHLEAAVTNILSRKPPYFERSVYYGGLTRESVEELQALAREGGMKLLRAVNRRALELSERDGKKDDAVSRINFGAYFYTDADVPHEGQA